MRVCRLFRKFCARSLVFGAGCFVISPKSFVDWWLETTVGSGVMRWGRVAPDFACVVSRTLQPTRVRCARALTPDRPTSTECRIRRWPGWQGRGRAREARRGVVAVSISDGCEAACGWRRSIPKTGRSVPVVLAWTPVAAIPVPRGRAVVRTDSRVARRREASTEARHTVRLSGRATHA
jgi:hypothetical protein